MGADSDKSAKTVKTIIQIHHYECDTEDDLIAIEHPESVTSDEVYQDFIEALRLKEADADGCRCIWVDFAMSVLKEKYFSVCYVENKSLWLELSWGMFDEEKNA